MQDNEIIVDNELEPARRKIGSGWIWIMSAFDLYRRAWLFWTTVTVLASVLLAAVAVIPVVGSLFVAVLLPVLLGGIMHTAKQADEGNIPVMMNVFSGFSSAKELAKVGLFYLLAITAILLVLGFFVMVTVRLGWMPPITPELIKTRGLRSLWPFLLMFFSCFSMVYSSYFFAPTLVVLQKLSALDAMRLSFLGFWRNWKPILLLGVIDLLLVMAASLPAMLGLLVVGPVMLLTFYTSYSDIYER